MSTPIYQFADSLLDGQPLYAAQVNLLGTESENFMVQTAELYSATGGIFGATQFNGAAVAGELSIDISAGAAFVGQTAGTKKLVRNAGTIRVTGLTAASTNYLWLKQDGTFQANTTGVQPANTHLVCTCVTNGSQVTSVDNAPTGRINISLSLSAPVDILHGGTGASTAAGARTNLGLGTIATQAANNVAITGGSITGITDLAIGDGGTGASTAKAAILNLMQSVPSTDDMLPQFKTDGTVTWVTNSASDHGGLTGLSDDDHTQYLLLAGRSGGQTVYGGTAASNSLTLESTSNATKGYVILQPNGGNVGIGTSSPSYLLHMVSASGAGISFLQGTSALAYLNMTDITLYCQTIFRESGTSKATIALTGSSNADPKWFIFSNYWADGGGFGIRTGGTTSSYQRLTIPYNGKVGIGDSIVTPYFMVDVNGDIRVRSTSKLYFGGTGAADNDTNLYRSATDTLKTDDHLVVTKSIGNASEINDGSPTAGAQTIDWSTGNAHYSAQNSAMPCTFTFTAPTAIGTYYLRVKNTTGGAISLIWPAAVKWDNDTEPSTPSPGKTNLYRFYYNGTNYLGSAEVDFNL